MRFSQTRADRGARGASPPLSSTNSRCSSLTPSLASSPTPHPGRRRSLRNAPNSLLPSPDFTSRLRWPLLQSKHPLAPDTRPLRPRHRRLLREPPRRTRRWPSVFSHAVFSSRAATCCSRQARRRWPTRTPSCSPAECRKPQMRIADQNDLTDLQVFPDLYNHLGLHHPFITPTQAATTHRAPRWWLPHWPAQRPRRHHSCHPLRGGRVYLRPGSAARSPSRST